MRVGAENFYLLVLRDYRKFFLIIITQALKDEVIGTAGHGTRPSLVISRSTPSTYQTLSAPDAGVIALCRHRCFADLCEGSFRRKYCEVESRVK